eukprot:TRINITY_DN7148_c0_g1_i7.p1 TRINITY_DN7148_c0_g1~~TRINITY_DN7148_c0_g1_i7.p1  ORF type:complete len:171 (-),score=36.01 TRINITY_DN7148_c0_g1_i7:76-588(-)
MGNPLISGLANAAALATVVFSFVLIVNLYGDEYEFGMDEEDEKKIKATLAQKDKMIDRSYKLIGVLVVLYVVGTASTLIAFLDERGDEIFRRRGYRYLDVKFIIPIVKMTAMASLCYWDWRWLKSIRTYKVEFDTYTDKMMEMYDTGKWDEGNDEEEINIDDMSNISADS